MILVQKQAQINFIPSFVHLCRVALYSCCANIWLIEQHCARARVCVSMCARLEHLAEFLPVGVRQECLQGLESCVDALHTPALVAISDFPANSPLLVLSSLWTEGDVGQAEGERSNEEDDHDCVVKSPRKHKFPFQT